MKYKKYFRKTSLKQEGIGEHFLNEIASKKPKNFLEIGVFHGVTARNVCELLHSIHGSDFKYVGLDLFGESAENANEVIPNTKFNNPLKKLYRLREINLATIALDHKDEDEMKSMRALVAELPETEFIMSLVKKEFQAFDQLLRFHAEIEDQLLFPKAIAMEKQIWAEIMQHSVDN